MKRLIALMLAVLTVCTLWACKKEDTDTTAGQDQTTAATQTVPTLDEGGPGETEEYEGGPGDEEMGGPTDVELAEAYEGQPLEFLIDEMGEPLESSYVTSTVDSSWEEGTLIYSTFIVYTQRTEDGELISDVAPKE